MVPSLVLIEVFKLCIIMIYGIFFFVSLEHSNYIIGNMLLKYAFIMEIFIHNITKLSTYS